MPTYPMISFLLRFKKLLPWAAAALVLAAGLWGLYRTGVPEWAVGGVIMAAVIYVVVTAALEVVHVISDVLIPQ